MGTSKNTQSNAQSAIQQLTKQLQTATDRAQITTIKQALQVLSKYAGPPQPSPPQQPINTAALQKAVNGKANNLPAPPKPFHTPPGKTRKLGQIKQAQSAGTSYKDFLKRALSGVSQDEVVDTKILREQLGLPQEEPEQTKNLYLMEDLTEAEKFTLFRGINERLGVYFDSFKPAVRAQDHTKYNSVCYHTTTAYSYKPELNFEIKPENVTEEKVIKACLLIAEKERLFNTDNKETATDLMGKEDQNSEDDVGLIKKVGSKVLKELYHNSGDIDKVEIMEALDHYKEQGKVVSVLEDSQKAYADIHTLTDKYSIRIGDGERFVASDKVKITFRDPSDNPSWAMWFLDAVPLSKVPDRSAMFFLPKDQWDKYYPEPLESFPIICHASLWQLPDNQTGVLLHTAWHNLAVAYRWQIDKPLDVARIMFKAVSHPAHIARNFGFAPQIREPGEAWF